MKTILSISALILSLSYAIHVFIEFRELNLSVSENILKCYTENVPRETCIHYMLKYGIFNKD